MKIGIQILLLFGLFILLGCSTQLSHQTFQCDRSTPETAPLSRFDVNQSDGTVLDIHTNLRWKICAEGQTYSIGHCAGPPSEYSWISAMQVFGADGDGWRLPSVDELNSIVEKQCQDPSVNIETFPNTQSTHIWTNVTYGPNEKFAWRINFFNGISGTSEKTRGNTVRLVRGKQWVDAETAERKKETERLRRESEESRHEAERKKLEDEQNELHAAIQAERDAYVLCNDKASCDKAFSLTQIYIASNSSQKIQVATDTIIETYNPSDSGSIGMNAMKIPGKGAGATIRVTVSCKVDQFRIYERSCEVEKTKIYNGYRKFIEKMLIN